MFHDIYALCDMGMLRRFKIGLEEFVQIAQNFGAQIMQYRDKESTLEEKMENLKKLRSLWSGILIVNDEWALARVCDGVHVGQEDLLDIIEVFGARSKAEGVTILRHLSGAKIVGLSTHNKEEILEANGLDLDYIGLGAYRASTTKEVSFVLGPRLEQLASCSTHKVVAIGGVRLFDSIAHVWKRAIGSDLVIKALTYA
ncbi:MAG: thiamine phosphate synthase [Epsilonproteobacteria bacterium]|nr:thiamine phosphate synthase [Campylobacterota bacterium]NPA64525.1 thiamine phosphate synthase [Campylobacterota bacterium]